MKLQLNGAEFYDRHGIMVTWAEGKRSCLYHAVYVACDGNVANRSLCGVTGLRPIQSLWSLTDPSNDLMTCLRCAELVIRRKKPTRGRSRRRKNDAAR